MSGKGGAVGQGLVYPRKAINYMLRWGTGKTGLHIKMGQRRIEFRSLIENVRYKELIPIQMIYPYPQQDGSLWSKS